MPNGNVTIYADFVLEEYDIFVATDNGSVSMSNSQAYMGTTVSVAATPYIGTRFIGWRSDDVTFADSSATITTFVMPARDISIEAIFERVDLYQERDISLTMVIPNDVTIIEEEAFQNTAARYFVIPRGIQSIESRAFPEGSTVFISGTGGV